MLYSIPLVIPLNEFKVSFHRFESQGITVKNLLCKWLMLLLEVFTHEQFFRSSFSHECYENKEAGVGKVRRTYICCGKPEQTCKREGPPFWYTYHLIIAYLLYI